MNSLKTIIIEILILCWFLTICKLATGIDNWWLRLLVNYIGIMPMHWFLWDGIYSKFRKM